MYAGDEGKPRCRNCIDRNLQCQYGAQLTFLEKNARTVQALEVETQSASYEAIRVGFPVTITRQRPDPYVYSSSLKRPQKISTELRIIHWTILYHSHNKPTPIHLAMPEMKMCHSGQSQPPMPWMNRITRYSMTMMNRRLRDC